MDVDPQLGRLALPDGLTVYTQNLYLGGDTGPLFTLDSCDVPAVIAAANVFWQDVGTSDFPGRAVEIANEIERSRPHVVTLQEVPRFVVLDGAFQPIGGLDLLAELAARGLPHVTEVVQANTSSTLPLDFDPTVPGISQWLDFTDRVVTLRRTDVTLLDAAHDRYERSVFAGPLEIVRGWTRVTVLHAGRMHHVVNTHLEIQPLAPIQAEQASELRDVVLAGLDGVTIVAGDLDSNASAGPGDPTWTPTYGSLVDARFRDT